MSIRLALLICDDLSLLPTVIETYGDHYAIYARFFRESLPKGLELNFVLDRFDVVEKQEYPSLDAGYDGVVVTGAAASVYSDLPWMLPLLSFLRTLAETRPKVKILGFCFGHQVIARALGGNCVPNNGRWEIGVADVKLNNIGKEIFGRPCIRVQQLHQDHVPALPPDFLLLGSTSVSPIQAMILPYESSKPSQIHIFTMQGHPEFVPGIVKGVLDIWEKSGVMDPEIVRNGRERANQEDDGTGIIGKAVWKILGVEDKVAVTA